MKTACGAQEGAKVLWLAIGSGAAVGVYTGVKGHNSGYNSVQAPVLVLALFPGFLHPLPQGKCGRDGGRGGGGCLISGYILV